LGVSWTEKRTNKSIIEEIKPEMPLIAYIVKQRLNYFSHVLRMNGSRIEKQIITGLVGGKRKRGRPPT
jgi:hypothetical protein